MARSDNTAQVDLHKDDDTAAEQAPAEDASPERVQVYLHSPLPQHRYVIPAYYEDGSALVLDAGGTEVDASRVEEIQRAAVNSGLSVRVSE